MGFENAYMHACMHAWINERWVKGEEKVKNAGIYGGSSWE
jgi:hypothetical protein